LPKLGGARVFGHSSNDKRCLTSAITSRAHEASSRHHKRPLIIYIIIVFRASSLSSWLGVRRYVSRSLPLVVCPPHLRLTLRSCSRRPSWTRRQTPVTSKTATRTTMTRRNSQRFRLVYRLGFRGQLYLWL
jgi:hypothetical protein